MLKALSEAGLLNLLSSEARSFKNMFRPDKIYCENPNEMYALCPQADQIKDIPNSFLAIDDIEIGFGSRIPLWMFGLLY